MSSLSRPSTSGNGWLRLSLTGHCRRRKIRCIPSASDTQGRCANCIRLKKECSFIPTEQQQSSDTRHRAAGQSQSDSPNPSKSSSPGPTGSSTASKPSPRQFPPLATNASNMPPPPIGANHPVDGALGKSRIYLLGRVLYTELWEASMSSPGQPYNVNQDVPSWMPTGIQPFLPTTPTNWNNPWTARPIESSMVDHGTEPPLSATWAPTASESGLRDMAWGQMSVPVRSFSYSGESLNGPNTAQFMPIPQGGPQGRQPYVTPSMSIGSMGDSYQSGMESDGPMSPVDMSHQAQMQWQQHQSFLRSQAGWSGATEPTQWSRSGSSG